MAVTYSLVLSKGTHLVDERARARVVEAIANGERLVEIAVDRFQDGTTTRATIVTSHIVAFFPHEPLDETELPENVTPFARRA